MDVILKTPELKVPVAVAKGSGTAAAEGTARPQIVPQKEASTVKATEATKIDRDDLNSLTQELNKFMDSLNVDIQFAIHDKTKQVMVQVLDIKEQRVLREYPAHELLDTLAAIREYVGVLLDKKA